MGRVAKPCRGCGGPKGFLPGRSYCTTCRPPVDRGLSDEPCMICGGPVPLGAKGQQRLACNKPECRSEMQSLLVSRASHVIRSRKEVRVGERECRKCGEVHPLTIEHFRRLRGVFRGYCRACDNELEARGARALRAWLKENDPEEYARRLADDRLSRRMRMLEEGRTPRWSMRDAAGAYREPAGATSENTPAAPLRVWLTAYLRETGEGRGDFAERAGLSPRRIWAVESGDQRSVSLSTADRMVWNANQLVRIEPSDVEAAVEAMEAYWRAAPGNGERLLGYLDDVERVAHLPGMVVERIEDLWPELAS